MLFRSISNIGSFGEHVYKIGMTRRLEPLDRVRELGDASVPFRFDVHAMVFCENAPELEADLHRAFDDRRLNLVNKRKEFFSVELKEIVGVVRKKFKDAEFTMTAVAEEHQKTLALRAERAGAAPEEAQAVETAKSVFEARQAQWAEPLDGAAPPS